MKLYSTCQVIIGYGEDGGYVLCVAPTLDGSAFCSEHKKDGTALLPWDDEDFPDDEFTPTESGKGSE